MLKKPGAEACRDKIREELYQWGNQGQGKEGANQGKEKGFAEELKASNIVLPTMDYEKENDFPGLAAALVPDKRLPDRLQKPCSHSKKPPPRKTMIACTRPPTADSPASASVVSAIWTTPWNSGSPPPTNSPNSVLCPLSSVLRSLPRQI